MYPQILELILMLLFFIFCVYVVGWAILVGLLVIMSIIFKGNWRHYSIMLLIWSTFPLLFPRYVKKKRIITDWPSPLKWAFAFFSPCTIAVLFWVVGFLVFFLGMDLPSKCNTLGKEGANISSWVISLRTGVDFPKLDYVDGKFYNNFPDYSTDCTMKVKGAVPKEFVEELKESDKWRKEENKYVYLNQGDHELAPMTIVEVDTNSGLVKMSYITF